MPTPKEEKWIEKFNQKFPLPKILAFSGGKGIERDLMIQFIRNLLASHTEELREKYENCPQCVGLREEFKKELREKIEKFIDENDDGMWAGRETADRILSLLSNNKE